MTVDIICADAIEALAEMDADSVDAVVTDPPYGLEFMGKGWDTFSPEAMAAAEEDAAKPARIPNRNRPRGGTFPQPAKAYAAGSYDFSPRGNRAFQEWCYTWAAAALRVLRPGGHLVAFGGTRTHHRLWCALEDAGFEIRDTLMWLYGSGFPKSLDVSKAIDKAAGAEREVVGQRTDGRYAYEFSEAASRSGGIMGEPSRQESRGQTTAPATDAARQWDGWGTALKPAWEPIVLARKPLVGTVAANVQEHGTGALNVDGCRVGTTKDVPASVSQQKPKAQVYGRYGIETGNEDGHNPNLGRWPANVVLDEEAAAMLDAQSGEAGGGGPASGPTLTGPSRSVARGHFAGVDETPYYGDSGGASRFFYCAKASRAERGKGNTHPTVKPLALMRWLCRLVTPAGGLILDPFLGSGTTAVAAIAEGFRCVGIDSNPEYCERARHRTAQRGLAAS